MLASWRRVPIDLIAFIAIALALAITHVPLIRHGMNLNDTAWYFHFGKRALDGDMPFRDYIFQVGPLPIFVDAGFQKVFGVGYLASLYAGLFVKILRVFVVWMIVRRLAGLPAAALFAAFCAADLSFSWIHHWSTPYSQLFFTTSGLFFLLATRASSERRILVYLALAGLFAALIVSARQSTAVMTALVLAASSAVLAYRRELTGRRLAALWGGFAMGLVLIGIALASIGAFGPAIQQMFLDAPEKKSVHGLDTVLDPISGGAMELPGRSWWGGFLSLIALPVGFVAIVIRALARPTELAGGTAALLAMSALVAVGLIARDASLSFYYDAPRTLLTATTAIAVLFPARARTWFGVEPLALVGLGALPLASDWANELSLPGRGWGDIAGLIVGVVLVALASTRLSRRAKTGLCAGFAAIGLVHVTCTLDRDVDPFTRDIATDGTLAMTSVEHPDPLMAGIFINAGRKRALDWLAANVEPNTTCFMYGNLVALYDLLHCTNPTRIDTTIADFLTAENAREAIATLQAQPPEYLIAQDRNFTNPPLTLELGDDPSVYSIVNPQTAYILHRGLRELLPRYELIGVVSEQIGPELDRDIGWSWDQLSATRLYRLRR